MASQEPTIGQALPTSKPADMSRALDELHTIAALLSGSLALADAGTPVERSLRITTEVLDGLIVELTKTN